MRICSVEGCDKRHYGKGLCRTHWRQQPQVRVQRSAQEKRRVAGLTGERFERYRQNQRAGWRRKNTGWTQTDVERALLEQHGRCALCEVLLVLVGNRDPASLTADHNHETKRKRGLLCRTCNVLEGWHLLISTDEEEWGKRVKAYRAKYG